MFIVFQNARWLFMLFSIALFIFAGITAGISSGLFGLGGGIILVPALLLILHHTQSFVPLAMHIAIGTSMACIMINSISTTCQHVQTGSFDFTTFKRLAPSLMIGTAIGCFVGHMLSEVTLHFIFLSILLIALFKSFHQLIKPPSKKINDVLIGHLPKFFPSFFVMTIVGFLSAASGTGIASLTVPFLRHHHYSFKGSTAQSSSLSATAGFCAILTYIYLGWSLSTLPPYSIGYIYLPAILPSAISGAIGSKIGVMLYHRLSDTFQHLLFSGILLVIVCLMIINAFDYTV